MADQAPAPRAQPAPRVNGQPDRGMNPNGIPSEAVRARQKMLVEKGYSLTVDGIDGESTKAAYKDWQNKQQERAAAEQQRLEREAEATREAQRNAAAVERTKAEAEAKRAEAETKAAEARAAEAAAKSREAEAAAAATKAKAEADKRQADADRGKLSTPLLAAAVLGGSAYGAHKASKLKAEYDGNVAAQNSRLAKSAKTIEGLVSKAERQKGAAKSATLQKVAAHVRAVDQKRLTHAPSGIKGAAAAALPLLVESLAARALGATLEEGYTKDVVNEVSTGLGLAGSVLFGSRYTSIKNAGDPIDAHAVGTVNTGRNAAKRQLAPPKAKAAVPAAPASPVNRAMAAAQKHGGKVGIGIGAASALALMAQAANASDGKGDSGAAGLALPVAVAGAGVGALYMLNRAMKGEAKLAAQVAAMPSKGASVSPALTKAVADLRNGRSPGWSDAAREASIEQRQADAAPKKGVTATRADIASAKREAKVEAKAARAAQTPAARPTQAVVPTTQALVLPTPAKVAPPPVPPIIAAAEKASAKVHAGQAIKGSGVAKAAGKMNGLLAGASLVTGLFSLVQTARSQGIAAAGKEALAAIDPTSGVAGKILDKLTTEDKPEATDLRALAKEQAALRTQTQTAPGPEMAIEAAKAQGYMPAGHAELVDRVLQSSGLAEYYGGSFTPQTLDRLPYMGMAADFARDANSRPDPQPQMDAALANPPAQVRQSIGGPRGFQLEHVREAAAQARREKRGY